MRIEDISIFGEYSQPENKVTAAFLQICKVGGEQLIRRLTKEIGILIPNSEIEISSQVKRGETVPDGLLESNFSFKLFVESKIKKNSVNSKQLEGHKKNIKPDNDFLLYLTPDESKPENLKDTFWASWKDVDLIFADYLQTSQIDNKPLLEFLIGHFHTLLDNLDLLDSKWDLNNDRVLILAGSWAEGVALKYNYYMGQNKRSFRPSKYLAFYINGEIRYYFEILKAPEEDVDLRERSLEFGEYLKTAEPNYSGEVRQIIKLSEAYPIKPILNDTMDKNGNPCPFTYGQPRYTTLSDLKSASRTSELKNNSK